jgi:putative endonuclease
VTRSAGAAAEDLALAHLQRQGLALKARNFTCRMGEIDLIMEERGTLVFVEVRQRSSSAFGSAAESITARKREKLLATARFYLARRADIPPCRFDAVLVDGQGRIDWIRDAFGE